MIFHGSRDSIALTFPRRRTMPNNNVLLRRYRRLTGQVRGHVDGKKPAEKRPRGTQLP